MSDSTPRTRMRRVALPLVVTLATALAASAVGAMTNGQPDGEGHPYVVVLTDDWRTPGYYERFCTGTLVAPRIVVTAAHCLLELVDPEVWVSFDSVYRPGESSLIHGTGIAAVDPELMRGTNGFAGKGGISDLGNGIAVVHLDETAPVDHFAQLPTAELLSSMTLGEQTFTAVGYGRTRVDRTAGPNNIELNVDPDVRNVSIEAFRNVQAGGALTLSGNPSTGDGGICGGDSGGPHFLGDSDVMVAISITADEACRSLVRAYRPDIRFARQFLASQGVPLP